MCVSLKYVCLIYYMFKENKIMLNICLFIDGKLDYKIWNKMRGCWFCLNNIELVGEIF